MYAYIAWALFTNLETFSRIIDFQKKCYGKYTLTAVFCCWFIYTKYHANFSNDLFLVKQLYMGTYVFKICKILEISSLFVNEIMILEMIYRNRTKRHVWAKSTKTI
jgi:hypothetical protein